MNEAKPGGRVGLREVAQLAGVSPSTVSNLLNGRHGRMRASTQNRVRAAMQELGYTPNQLARQLRTGRVHTIGLVVPSVANPFWGFVARYVEEAAREHGYQMLLCNAERDKDRESQYVDTLLRSGVRGVIFGSSPVSLEHLAALPARGLQVVVFDRALGDAEEFVVGSVEIDNALGARLAISHLIGLGHRRIAFLSGPVATESRRQRLEGYRQALTDAGLRFDPGLVWQGGGSLTTFGDAEGAELGRVGAHHLLSAARRPSALFTINDMYAIGAYAGVRDLGLRVPEDISIVGVDDLPVLAEVMTPPLTTVRQPLRDMMQLATAELIGRVEGDRTGSPEHVTAIPELIVRGSTSRPQRKKPGGD